MTKLKTLLVAALLTVPVLTLSAAVPAEHYGSGPRLETTAATGCCWVLYFGRWFCIPC